MEESKEKLVLRCANCKATITSYGDKNCPLPDYAQAACEKCGGVMYGEKEKATQEDYALKLNREIKEHREAHKREIRDLLDKYGILASDL